MTSEKKLIERARAFHQAALAEIYDHYSPGLYRYAMRMLGDVDQAEECVAETFSRFLNALQRGVGPTEHLQAYLYRIAHNWITDQFRRQPPLPLDLDFATDPDLKDDPRLGSDDVIMRDKVRSALRRLTSDQRQVVVLKFLEGWSNAEVAEAMDKPVGAVKSLQHRGLAALRRLLLKEVSDQNEPDER